MNMPIMYITESIGSYEEFTFNIFIERLSNALFYKLRNNLVWIGHP